LGNEKVSFLLKEKKFLARKKLSQREEEKKRFSLA
jgi:hypothetical protein